VYTLTPTLLFITYKGEDTVWASSSNEMEPQDGLEQPSWDQLCVSVWDQDIPFLMVFLNDKSNWYTPVVYQYIPSNTHSPPPEHLG